MSTSEEPRVPPRLKRQDSYSTNPEAFNWSNNFWGNDGKALEVVMQKMRSSKHTGEEVLQLLQQRAAIEEEYGKKLEKLSKLALGIEEPSNSTLRNALDLIRSELSGSANSRLHLASQLRLELEQKIATLLVTQATVRKPFQATTEKLFKAKSAQQQQLQHAKETLDAATSRLSGIVAQIQQRLHQATPDAAMKTLSLEEQKTLHSTIEKAREEQQTALSDYNLAVNKSRDLQSMWEQEWTNALIQFQKLESERATFLKASLWAYTNMLSVVDVAEDEGCERIRCALEKMDVAKDMGDFVRAFGTGTKEASRSSQPISNLVLNSAITSPLASPDSPRDSPVLTSSKPIDIVGKTIDPSVPVVSVAIPGDKPGSVSPPNSANSTLTTKQLQEMHRKRMFEGPTLQNVPLPLTNEMDDARPIIPLRSNSGNAPPPVIPIRANSGGESSSPPSKSPDVAPVQGFAPRVSSLKARTPSPNRDEPIEAPGTIIPPETIVQPIIEANVELNQVVAPPRNPSLRKSLSGRNSIIKPSSPLKPPSPLPVPIVVSSPSSLVIAQDQAGLRVPQDATPEDEVEEDYDPYDLTPKPILCWCEVLFPYESQAFEELSIIKGLVLPVVTKQEDGWWEGEMLDSNGQRRRGLFPSNFVKVTSEGPEPPKASPK